MSKKLLLLLSLVCFINCYLSAQERVAYELSDFSSQSGGVYDHLLSQKEAFRFNWSAIKLTYSVPDKPLEGRLQVVISGDSIPGNDDIILLDTLWSFANFSYQEIEVSHQSSPGEYYLLTTFYASDTAHFMPQSNILKKRALIYNYEMKVADAYLTHLSISEYNEETVLHLKVNHQLSCCSNLLGTLNGQLQVFLSNDDQLTQDDLVINTFFVEDTLAVGVESTEYKANLYGAFELEKYNYFIVSRSSGYFTNGYRTVSDQVEVLPLRLIRNIEEVNKLKQEQYPFLTYGSFEIPPDSLSKIDVQQLYDEAGKYFELYEKAMKAADSRDYNIALELIDSAFAYVGNHRNSSLLYTSPDMISEMYSGLLHLSEDNSDREALSFRLGEAMKMSDLMEQAYENLVKQLLPDSLGLAASLEESGFYGNKATFNQELLFNVPVVWKKYSLPALKHFVQVQDYESADLIIQQVREHIVLYWPLWNILSGNEEMKKAFFYLGSTLAEYNDMLDITLAMLDFYTVTGFFEEGRKIKVLAELLFQCTDGSFPAEYWKTTAAFAESTRNWKEADSLYGLLDDYHQKLFEKQEDGTSLLGKYWMDMQHKKLFGAKTGTVQELSQEKRAFNTYIDRIKNDQQLLFLYMDLVSSRYVSQLAGFYGSQYYPGLYVHNIESLEAQQEYFLASDWKKELAFFLGRDDRNAEALSIYSDLFVIENMKSQAFRLSFSEEAQIFYFAKQQEMLSRFISLLGKLQQENDPGFNKALEKAFEQTLFYHSYVLRGNFRMLYDVYKSEDQQVQLLYEKWRVLREYLNKLYVNGDTEQKDILLLKQEIGNTENELIRLSRDTTSFYFDHLPDAEAIRDRLGEGEAAVEIVQYKENHEVYYGNKVRYSAFIIRKDSPEIKLIHFADGERLETRNYQFYRNAIKYKQPDTLSYKAFWEPVARHLKDVRRVFWAPDGVFHLINPSTLYNPKSKQYLLGETDLQVVPTIAQIPSKEPTDIKSAMLLGNPEYIKESASSGQNAEQTTRNALLHNRIADLPGTKTEVDRIGSLLQDNQSEVHVLTHRDATKRAVFEHNQTDLLHFATHGFWIDQPAGDSGHHLYESLSNSGLVLADAQTVEHDEYKLHPEGILTAAEIQDMYLFKSKLVVLSACETGLGEVVAGEGLYGLKRAFQRAGVENIITSLWKVDDQVTQQFMIEFYKRLLDTKDLSGSFKTAMLAVKTKYPEPYYWGAFVLTSNR